MRFKTLKNRPNFACEHAGFLQRQSLIFLTALLESINLVVLLVKNSVWLYGKQNILRIIAAYP